MTAVTTGTRRIASHEEAIAVADEFAESIADGVIARDRAGAVPVTELARLDGSGLLAITLPSDHGGPDLSPVTLVEVIRRIATVDPAIAQAPHGHFLLVDILAVWGTAGQRRRLFTEVAAGARLGNCLAERGGTHAQDVKTRLRTTPEGPRLDGPSITARARSARAGSAPARSTTPGSSCWRSPDARPAAWSSTRTGTSWVSGRP